MKERVITGTVKLSSLGQLVVPKPIREKLKMQSGDVYVITIGKNKTVVCTPYYKR